VAFAGLASMAAAVGLLTSSGGHHLARQPPGIQVGTVVLVLALAGYVMEKERHLRRLATLLVNERVLGAALSNRLKELAVLYEAGKALNSVLVIEEVLQLILSSAFELLEASNGFIMLLEVPTSWSWPVAPVSSPRTETSRIGRRDRQSRRAGPGATAHSGNRLRERSSRTRQRRLRAPDPSR